MGYEIQFSVQTCYIWKDIRFTLRKNQQTFQAGACFSSADPHLTSKFLWQRCCILCGVYLCTRLYFPPLVPAKPPWGRCMGWVQDSLKFENNLNTLHIVILCGSSWAADLETVLTLREVDFWCVWGEGGWFSTAVHSHKSPKQPLTKSPLEPSVFFQWKLLCVFNKFAVLQTRHMADQA